MTLAPPLAAASRLADLEGPGAGRPLSAGDIAVGIVRFRATVRAALSRLLIDVDASRQEEADALQATADYLGDLIADATARQLRVLEEGEI